MILLINICKEKLHFYEFVKPVWDIVNSTNQKVVVKHYSGLTSNDIKKADKVIICGTSLKDNDFLEHIDRFSWIKDFNKPLLGICGGMQIIAIINGKQLTKKAQIGLIDNKYHLHNFAVKGLKNELKIRNYQGYLFHPEVRNKEMIEGFVSQ